LIRILVAIDGLRAADKAQSAKKLLAGVDSASVGESSGYDD
jgi:hypothetical protein